MQSLMLPSKLPVQSVPFNLVATVAILSLKTKYEGTGFALQEKCQNSSNISEFPNWALVRFFLLHSFMSSSFTI